MHCDFFQLAVPGVQRLHAYQPGKPIEALERELGLSNIVKLASNENPLGPSPYVLENIQASLKDLSRYPDGSGFILKHALAQKYGLNTDQITLGNGSNDLLELIARTFVSPGQPIVFSEHAFAVYPLVAQALGAKAVIVPAKQWGHDLTAMQAAINEETRLVFIANPNNPTGTWVNKTALETFLNALPPTVLVVVDEAYFEYVDEPDYPNSLEWLATYPNLIVVRTFSKAYGLAGLRVGYAIAHPDIADLLNRVRQPFNVNNLALIAASTALKDLVHLEDSLTINRAGMQQLTQAFTQLGLTYIPSVGNFVSVYVGDGAQMYTHLLQAGVITRPIGGIYNMPHHLRISIGLKEENEQLINALKKLLA